MAVKKVAQKTPVVKRKYTKLATKPVDLKPVAVDDTKPTPVTYLFRNTKESHFFMRFIDKALPSLPVRHEGDFTSPRIVVTFPADGFSKLALALLDDLYRTIQDAFPNFLENKRS